VRVTLVLGSRSRHRKPSRTVITVLAHPRKDPPVRLRAYGRTSAVPVRWNVLAGCVSGLAPEISQWRKLAGLSCGGVRG
jgi:hypothetical protein